MSAEEKLILFLIDFEKALNGFKIILVIDKENLSPVLREAVENGQIQKFEICIEQAWKTAKWFLGEKKGIVVNSPIPAIKNLYTEKIITEEVYSQLHHILKIRNYFSHIYKEEFFMSLIPEFPSYVPVLEQVLKTMQHYDA